MAIVKMTKPIINMSIETVINMKQKFQGEQ